MHRGHHIDALLGGVTYIHKLDLSKTSTLFSVVVNLGYLEGDETPRQISPSHKFPLSVWAPERKVCRQLLPSAPHGCQPVCTPLPSPGFDQLC